MTAKPRKSQNGPILHGQFQFILTFGFRPNVTNLVKTASVSTLRSLRLLSGWSCHLCPSFVIWLYIISRHTQITHFVLRFSHHIWRSLKIVSEPKELKNTHALFIICSRNFTRNISRRWVLSWLVGGMRPMNYVVWALYTMGRGRFVSMIVTIFCWFRFLCWFCVSTFWHFDFWKTIQ